MNNFKIPFICVNYNSHEETIKYIQSVLSLDLSELAIIVIVDNSPIDTEFEVLKKFIQENNNFLADKVFLLKRENKGYFQGLNDGIRYVQTLGISDTFYVVGNNDITFKNDFIRQLQQYDLNESVFVLAPDIVTSQNSHENPHVIDKIGFLQKLKYDIYYSNYTIAKLISHFKSLERKFKPYDAERKEIHMGIGALYVLTPYFFENFKILWEDVFLYGEEAILSGQIKSKNGKIVYEPDLVCFHNESATTSKMESKSKYYIVQESYKKYRKYL